MITELNREYIQKFYDYYINYFKYVLQSYRKTGAKQVVYPKNLGHEEIHEFTNVFPLEYSKDNGTFRFVLRFGTPMIWVSYYPMDDNITFHYLFEDNHKSIKIKKSSEDYNIVYSIFGIFIETESGI